MNDLHLVEVQDSEEARLEPDGNKGICVLTGYSLTENALILRNNSDGKIVLAYELVYLLHIFTVPDLHTVILADGDEFAGHLIVVQICNIVHV